MRGAQKAPGLAPGRTARLARKTGPARESYRLQSTGCRGAGGPMEPHTQDAVLLQESVTSWEDQRLPRREQRNPRRPRRLLPQRDRLEDQKSEGVTQALVLQSKEQCLKAGGD